MPFLCIQILFQLSFNVSDIVIERIKLQHAYLGDPNVDPNVPLTDKFLEISGRNYQQMFGENPEEAMMVIEWITYIMSTLLINIVGLNLLISVITEVYENVTAKLNAIDFKARL